MIALLAGLALLAPSRTVHLAAVGDVMLARYVGRRIEKEGPGAFFAGCRDELKRADLAFGNLECALTVEPFASDKRFLLRAKPEYAKHIAAAGFDVMSVANNHALDCGPAGLRSTLKALTAVGIDPVGATHEPLFLTKNGLRIAFLAFCDFPEEAASPGDAADLSAAIIAARKRADVVIVAWHWGTEGSPKPNPRQKHLAQLACEAGADLILGSHPHVLQPTVWLKAKSGRRCLVAYSLGNFVFDAPEGPQRTTAILNVELSAKGVSGHSVTPCTIDRGAPMPFKVGARR